MSDADGIVLEMRRERRKNILADLKVRYEQNSIAQNECEVKRNVS